MAERAGVSVSTVSRVLNDYPFVSEAARSRVSEAMELLDYRPDVTARAMRTGTTRAVGFAVSDITNPVFSAVAKGADEVLHPQGYSLVLATSETTVLLYGLTIMLIVAAAIEAFWSSAQWLPLTVKYSVAAACWIGVISFFVLQGRHAD